MNAISAALGGMTRAAARFDKASSDLVRSTSGASAVSEISAVTESLQAQAQFAASAAAMRSADDMMGALLDIRA